MSPEARITEKKKAMTLQQTKNLFHKKEIVNKMKMQPTKGEKIFVNDMSDKEGVDIQNIQPDSWQVSLSLLRICLYHILAGGYPHISPFPNVPS